MTTTIERPPVVDVPRWADLLEAALSAPGHLGDTYCRFYNYSYGNQILLMIQGVREPVATYKRWQEMGRQVLKGSKAKVILRPVTCKREIEDKKGEKAEATFMRFTLNRCLFALSETDGEPLPDVDSPGWDLARALVELEVTEVPFEELNGNVQGYSTGRTFAINPVAVNPLKTTFHELAHIALGHTSDAVAASDGYHRGLKEFQAEAVAHLVAHELGVSDERTDSSSRAYIQTWLRGETPDERAIRQVFTATGTILTAGGAR